MNELQKLIEKWDEQIALHRRVCEDPLMYTKEERLKNSHYAQAISAVVADLKKLTIPGVGGSLPTDEEIEKVAKGYDNSVSSMAESVWMPEGFKEGAKWMRKKLTGQ